MSGVKEELRKNSFPAQRLGGYLSREQDDARTRRENSVFGLGHVELEMFMKYTGKVLIGPRN